MVANLLLPCCGVVLALGLVAIVAERVWSAVGRWKTSVVIGGEQHDWNWIGRTGTAQMCEARWQVALRPGARILVTRNGREVTEIPHVWHPRDSELGIRVDEIRDWHRDDEQWEMSRKDLADVVVALVDAAYSRHHVLHMI